jgi:hypothetical protein
VTQQISIDANELSRKLRSLRRALLHQAQRDGLIVYVESRRNSESADWQPVDYLAADDDIDAENIIAGFRKYRLSARKPTENEIASGIGEQFAESAGEF